MSMRNAARYVEQAVQSISNQTVRDFEFVILDNASGDNSVEIVMRLAAQDPRIRLVRSERDLGHSGGLNRALEYCTARWIARMDADDVALPERFERQLDFLEKNPDVTVTSCLAHYIDADGQRTGKTVSDLTSREAFRRYMQNNDAIGILHPGAMIDRQLLVSAGGYRREFGPANDIDLWGRLCDLGALILVQPEYLMEYRLHGESIMASDFMDARHRFQWSRACMRARRAGNAEPAFEAFLEARRNAPWWLRLNRWRKSNAKRFYRRSGECYAAGRAARAMFDFGVATLLEPTYTLPRLKGQLSR